MITPEQSRAGRALLDISQRDLATAANLGESTVRDFEKGRRTPSVNNLAAIEAALKERGVVLIPQNGGGPGVRLISPSATEG
ncbi:helix-turn-helix transcriptional regulator [Rhizobium sp. EC-SD404]|uniref:helix-turn-helix domain-containing protein n=1 Tax=Rhizobium sp. EC-SD404 TaxID=2038389 RepID=UPI001250EB1A